MARESRPERKYRKLVIGMAGGIASGKSLVAGILGDLGAKVVDSDRLAHEELSDPEVIAAFRSWWGRGVCTPDGLIDRRAMSDIIFEEPAQRLRMEAYLYPRLERRRLQMMEAFDDEPSVRAIVVDSPLLYEVGLDKICDVVVFTEADRLVRLGRATKRRGWTEQEFDRREKLQESVDTKGQAADYRVVNNSTVDALRAQVEPLFERLLATGSD